MLDINEQAARGVVVVDLDGTLFDDRERRHFISGKNPSQAQYNRYHERLGDDPINHQVFEFVQNARSKGLRIAFATARPGDTDTWERTVKQLVGVFGKEFTFGAGFELLMRPLGNKQTSPALKKDMMMKLFGHLPKGSPFVCAVDDRDDVLEMMRREFGAQTYQITKDGTFPELQSAINLVNSNAALANLESGAVAQGRTAADILAAGAATFRERNANYRDNAVQVGQVMAALFPNGVTIKTQADHHFYHLFELLVVKLTRFANSDLKHVDSIHDLMVYAAMCENVIDGHSIKIH